MYWPASYTLAQTLSPVGTFSHRKRSSTLFEHAFASHPIASLSGLLVVRHTPILLPSNLTEVPEQGQPVPPACCACLPAAERRVEAVWPGPGDLHG